MGSGKSYVAQQLGSRLSLPAIDLDTYIVAQEGRSINEIFAQEGEACFRQKESFYLNHLVNSSAQVVATGGGTPCFANNIELMNRVGLTIFLNPTLELLLQRLENGREERPLLRALSSSALRGFVTNTLENRLSYYQQAKLIISFDQITENKVVDLILERMWEK